MKYTCVFYLDKKPKPVRHDKNGKEIKPYYSIDARIRINKHPIHYVTGYWVQEDAWRDEKEIDGDTGEKKRIMQVRKNKYGLKDKKSIAYNFINSDLRLIESTLYDLSKTDTVINTQFVKQQLDIKLKKTKNATQEEVVDNSLWTLFNEFKKAKDVGDGRRKSYENAYNNFKHFEMFGYKKPIDFIDCTGSLMEMFDNFMKTDNNDDGRYNFIENKREIPRPKGYNTRIRVLRVLSTFFNWVDVNKGITVKPFKTFKIKQEIYEDPIFLTIEERNKVYNYVSDNKTLERVRDLFFVQCCVGARVGDFMNLTKDNLLDDGTVIEYIADKTIKENPQICRITLTKKAQDIIKKYDMPNGKLLPFMSPQKYNEYIREILKELGIDRKVIILDKVTMKQKSVPIYEAISSHNARKTFIGSLKKKGNDNAVIGSMTGHIKNSKAFGRYYDVDDEQRREAIADIE